MKVWSVLKIMMKVGFFLCLIFLIVQSYNVYIYDKAHPTNVYSWNPVIGEDVPEEVLIKVDMYNTGIRIVWLCLLFYALIEVFAYFEDPKEHWATWFVTKIRGMKDE